MLFENLTAFPAFETEHLFSCLQDPATGPQSESAEFIPHPHIPYHPYLICFKISSHLHLYLSCEISSSHGGEYDVQSCLLGCTAV
jgi:hypothetical protein